MKRQIKPENVKSYMDKIATLKLGGHSDKKVELIKKYESLLNINNINLKNVIKINPDYYDKRIDEIYFLVRVDYDYMRGLIYNKDITLVEKTDIWNEIQKELLHLAKFLKSKGFKSNDNLTFELPNKASGEAFVHEIEIALHNHHFFGTFLRHQKAPILKKVPFQTKNPFTTQKHIKPFTDDND